MTKLCFLLVVNLLLCRCALRGWQAEGKRSKRVKALVVDKWAAAAREKLSRIFRTWCVCYARMSYQPLMAPPIFPPRGSHRAVFGRTRKARTVRRAVLLKSHKRRRDRRTMYLFFEKWNSVVRPACGA